MSISRCFVTGDTHGDIDIQKVDVFSKAHQTLTRDDYLIVLGDFGAIWYGDFRDDKMLDWWENQSYTTLFIDGNHENFDLLAQYPVVEWYGGKVQFIRPHVIHLMRGQVFNIDGLIFFCMGGAVSMDKAYRLEHISWWAQELPNYQEMDEGLHNLELNYNKVDYILTHTAPTAVLAEMYKYLGFYSADNFENYLEGISRTVSFKRWFFGHHHIDKYFNVFGNEYNALYDGIVEIG